MLEKNEIAVIIIVFVDHVSLLLLSRYKYKYLVLVLHVTCNVRPVQAGDDSTCDFAGYYVVYYVVQYSISSYYVE